MAGGVVESAAGGAVGSVTGGVAGSVAGGVVGSVVVTVSAAITTGYVHRLIKKATSKIDTNNFFVLEEDRLDQ